MARIAGVDLPRDKRIEVALTYIYGIGESTARAIVESTEINAYTRVGDLTEDEIARLREVIDRNLKVEGELRSEHASHVKRLIDIGSYRGLRHRRGVPVRGQRTGPNARTRKGPKKTVGARRGR